MSFNGLGLFTSPGLVMTPRRTSEQVVLGALDRLGARAARVVDVGTGSGALAIAIAVAAPRVEVWATDSDPHALGAQFGITRPAMPNVNAVLEAVPSQGRARERDPEAAVFSTGDGLDLYRRLLSSADKRLTASRAVILQVHRRVVLAGRAELADLRQTLSELTPEVVRPAVGPGPRGDELASLGRAA